MSDLVTNAYSTVVCDGLEFGGNEASEVAPEPPENREAHAVTRMIDDRRRVI